MSSLFPLDLHFGGVERAIGAYVLDCPEGPLLHDCGPATTLPRLKEALAECDLVLRDLRGLLLSHIHLDHAGAAGAIVREHPALEVWVSAVGAPHLVDPSRVLAGDALGHTRARRGLAVHVAPRSRRRVEAERDEAERPDVGDLAGLPRPRCRVADV